MSASGHVVLGVSGGIAAYKAVEILRGFQKAGLEVRCCMTESATHFVGPLTFAAISGHPVSHGRLAGESDAAMSHVEITRGAGLFVVAPATANTIARLALGLADDWLSTHALANEAPLLVAPAMNHRMLRNPSVQANLETLRQGGAIIVPPEDGELACGEVGAGRLADPALIVEEGLRILRGAGQLAGRTVLVTSGPTLEDVDDVRFVGNRSSGRMGHAIAAEAARRGATVVLVSGPVAIAAPAGCEVISVRSAAQMADAVAARLPACDAAVLAAAVADFTPARRAGKISRDDKQALSLELVRTRDVLAECVASKPRAVLVGFAAEVGDDWLTRAADKAKRKGTHLLVANRVDGDGSAFDAPDSEIVLIDPKRGPTPFPRAPKAVQAARILDALAPLLPKA